MNSIPPILLYTWAGLILGVSFIATPAKFKAAHLTLPLALEVGKATFSIFNKIEWLICLSILLISTIVSKSQLYWLLILCTLFLLLLETFWLLPVLDIRADKVIIGEISNPGLHHWIYIGADVLKILLTFMAGWYLMRGVTK